MIVSALRWTLLILGGLFIVALALWERARPRQARGRDDLPAARGAEPPSVDPPAAVHGAPGEPYIGEVPLPADVLADLPTLLVEETQSGARPAAPEAAAAELAGLEEGVGSVRVLEPTGPESGPVLHTDLHADALETAENPVRPVRLEWPAEAERHILAVRLVAGAERFSGRTLRLALAAEGFQLGPFEIFHKPDAGGRAMLSAASLTRPGTFDLTAMDSERFAGLNLFVVLPGPMPAGAAFDALLAAAQNLNERLQGQVQDERGEALSGERVARLRQSLLESAGGERV